MSEDIVDAPVCSMICRKWFPSKEVEEFVPISPKSIKVLWANAAGRCSFPECAERLCAGYEDGAAPYTLGEMAHIKGEKLGSNRHDPEQPQEERDSYSNLILLCPTHHTQIDKPENEVEYGVDVLRAMKEKHETFVSGRLSNILFSDKVELARFILPLMIQNREAFVNFGPHSEVARARPQSEAYNTWQYERLATIVPNNRRMMDLLQKNTELFASDEQAVLARFGLHVRSYDRWVSEDVNYEGVVRFPMEFEKLILGLTGASI